MGLFGYGLRFGDGISGVEDFFGLPPSLVLGIVVVTIECVLVICVRLFSLSLPSEYPYPTHLPTSLVSRSSGVYRRLVRRVFTFFLTRNTLSRLFSFLAKKHLYSFCFLYLPRAFFPCYHDLYAHRHHPPFLN